MIVSLSLMRRRSDTSIEEFRRHWLDPHGVMTAKLPGVKHYVQGHVVDSPAASPLAREIEIDGFAVLSFESREAREEAYTSPRIRECDKDSEGFVGSVSRVVTQSEVITAPTESDTCAKVYVLRFDKGGANSAWADAFEQRALAMAHVCGYVRHTILSQAGAPGSKVPVLDLPVSGVAEVWFDNGEALRDSAAALAGEDEASRAGVYVARDHRLI